MRITSTILWRQEGTGAFNSWHEYLELRKRSNGSLCVALTRQGIDYRGSATVFRSAPFKRPEQLLRILLDPPGDLDGWDEMPDFRPSDMLLILAELVEFDTPFALLTMRAYADRLDKERWKSVRAAKEGPGLAEGV